jgi:hypothetical protein
MGLLLVMTVLVVTSVKTVGSKKVPPSVLRLLPVRTLAASAMCASPLFGGPVAGSR